MAAAARVDHPGALGHGIRQQRVEVIDLARLRQRGQRHARFPGHARLEGGQFGAELVEERLQHVVMHEEDLQRGAALAVEGEGAGDRLADGVVEVDLRQDDAGVLRIQAEGGAQAVRARVEFLQVAGAGVGADEGEHVDLAAGHQRADGVAALAVDDVDHPRREAVAERFQQRADQQHAELGRLEHHGVAHDQRRDQGSEGFVQRVVVRAHAQRHAHRHAADLAEGALFQFEAAGAAVQFLERLDGVDDVVAGAVELLLGVLEVLADLPHQQLHHRLALFAHAGEECLDVLDALGHAQGRPQALAVVVGCDCRIQRRQRGVGVEQRCAAEDDLFVAVLAGQEDRAAHRGERAFPALEFAVQQVFALLDGRARAVLLGDAGSGGEEVVEVVVVVHCQFLWSGKTVGRVQPAEGR
ncbi:hypothetical protein D3C76_945320 [compost metagenome]